MDMKKSLKWIAAFVAVTAFCGIGKYFKDRYDSATVGLENFTPADLFVEETSDNGDKTDAGVYKININTATVEELCELKNIGEKTALRIVEFRESYGKFDRAEELKLVDGIGDKMFSEISGFITVE